MTTITERGAAAWSRMRLRHSAHLRDLTSETAFTSAHLIQPIFVVEGLTQAVPITGLGDNARLGLDTAADVVRRDVDAGVRHFLVFPVPANKERRGWTPHVAMGGTLAIHDVFPDPADGGRPPYEQIFVPALESGRFRLRSATGSLRILQRVD